MKTAMAELQRSARIVKITKTSLPLVTHFATTEDMVKELKPADPVHCYRPRSVERAAKWFLHAFPGTVMYSVKSNPDPLVLSCLHQAGVRVFDVASLAEVELIAATFPRTKMYFMHPVKPREAIAKAYFDYGVRAFSLDSEAELQKILEVTGHANDLELFVRLDISNAHAAYALSGKFGVKVEQASALIQRTRAVARRFGICFHVGSQCMDPQSFAHAIARVKALVDATGVALDVLDVGGGFPSVYPDLAPPPLNAYMAQITQAVREAGFDEKVELMAEPGRALVAESGSVVVRVELRKDNKLYLNDGTYGALFDAGHPGFTFPVKAIRPEGTFADTMQEFSFFGPTCDSIDAMKGPFVLPADIEEGDWIEVGQMGAYGATMRTRFNGFYSDHTVKVDDLPQLSMYERN